MRGGSQEEPLKHALKFLSYRARSEAEVRAKLKQLGFPQQSILSTLERLRSLNLLNDESFARSWARSRAEGRGYGPLKVERELRQKGISQAITSQAVQETFGGQATKEKARHLLEKRFRGQDLANAKIMRRAVGFLQRRGYRDAMIAELLRRPFGDD